MVHSKILGVYYSTLELSLMKRRNTPRGRPFLAQLSSRLSGSRAMISGGMSIKADLRETFLDLAKSPEMKWS